MLGNTFNLVLGVCLVASVAGFALERNKRQLDFPVSESNLGPYGYCGKPTTPIPNGGIKLFPVRDHHNIHDHSCDTGSERADRCEPKFYCDDGYEVNGDFNIHCQLNFTTWEYEWKGDIPTCVRPISRGHVHVYFFAFPVFFVVSLILIAIRYCIRRTRDTEITICGSSTVSTGPSIFPGRKPPYARFDDSKTKVPKGGKSIKTKS